MALTGRHLYPLEGGRELSERERLMSDKVKPKPKVADAMKILRQYMPKR